MIERKIQDAFAHATPDVWEQIREKCEAEVEKEKIVPIAKHKKKAWITKVMGLVASVVLLGGATLFGVHYYQSNHAVASVISLGKNAGINLVVNAEGTVLEVKALNKENRIIATNLRGYALEDAINEIIAVLEKYGYLEGAKLVISIQNDTDIPFSKIHNQLWSKILLYMEDRSIKVEIVPQETVENKELVELVATYDIPFYEAKYVQATLAVTSLYTIEELIEMDIQMLVNISYQDHSIDYRVLPDGTTISDEGSLYPGKLIEYAYHYVEDQGVVLDKFHIQWLRGGCRKVNDEWIFVTEIRLWESVSDASDIQRVYVCTLNRITGEVLSCENRISNESIEKIVLEDAYAEKKEALGELVSEKISIHMVTYNYENVYRVTFKTENYWVQYEIGYQKGTILDKKFMERK